MQNNLQEPLRHFILSPVIKAIENEEPMEYLTEMRFVVILFLNVITDVSDGQALLQVVDKAYKDVCRSNIYNCIHFFMFTAMIFQ